MKSITRWSETAVLMLALAAMSPALAQTYWYSTDGDGTVSVGSSKAKRAYLGVQMEEEIDHSEGGARVTRVVEDSPADRAGLLEGDIIVAIDGKTIRGPMAMTRQIHAAEPGDKATLKVLRDGKRRTIDLEFGERKSPWAVVGDRGTLFSAPSSVGIGNGFTATVACDDDEEDCPSIFTLGDCKDGDCGSRFFFTGGRPVLGVELVEVTDELREHLGGDEDAGVLISKIVSGSPAERAGLQVGDLIVAVAGDRVGNTRDLRRALQDKRGETFQVEIVRERRSRSIQVEIPEPDDDRPTGPRAQLGRSSWPVRHAVTAPAPPTPPVAIRVSVAPAAVPPVPPVARIAPVAIRVPRAPHPHPRAPRAPRAIRVLPTPASPPMPPTPPRAPRAPRPSLYPGIV